MLTLWSCYQALKKEDDVDVVDGEAGVVDGEMEVASQTQFVNFWNLMFSTFVITSCDFGLTLYNKGHKLLSSR